MQTQFGRESSLGNYPMRSVHSFPRFFSITSTLVFFFLSVAALKAATNPVPSISIVTPTAVSPGSADFTLSVLGTGFINGQSAIFWNGASLPDPTVCTAAAPPNMASCAVTVRAAMVATATTANITVVNPGPGGTSNAMFLEVSDRSPSVGFSLSNPFATSYPFVVAAGDFNGDGRADLAVIVEINPQSLSILLGNGDGTFAPTPASPINLGYIFSESIMVKVADFNNDGRQDLLIADQFKATFFILLGNGDGTFGPPVTTPSPFGPNGGFVALGDFNGDGILDVAETNGRPDVSVFLGNGDGTFKAIAPSPVYGTASNAIVTGDFNGDGFADLAVLSVCENLVGGCTPSESGNLTILLGDGTGKFTPTASPISTGNQPVAIAAGDFNGDGKLDLVIADICGSQSGCSPGSVVALLVLIGDGLGGFNPTVAPPSLSGPIPRYFDLSVGAADFNADGNLDLWVDTGAQIAVLEGNGTGNFPIIHTQTLSSDIGPVKSAIADFNGDGRLDIAGLSFSGVSVLLQSPFLNTAMTHEGVFGQGESNAQYNVTVSNGGSLPTVGVVTLTDSLPDWLTATDASGSGWDCSGNIFPVSGNYTPSLSCIRSDSLAPGESYPPITLITNVAANAPALVTNSATVTGGGNGNTDTNTATDQTTVVTYNVSIAASLSFPDQIVDNTSSIMTARLTVGGTGTLTISTITVSGDFEQTNDCSSSIVAGSGCTFSVTFTPTAAGNRMGWLTISDDAPGSPHTVALNGTGQDFAMAPAAGSTTTASVTAGSTANFMLLLAPAGGFSKPVSLTCSGQPALSACILSPTVVTLNPTTPTPVAVAVTTNSGASMAPLGRVGPPSIGVPPLLGLALLMAACLCGVIWTSRGRARIRLAFASAVLAAVMVGAVVMPGCGGGMPPAEPASPGTPSGTYHLNVTATFAQGTETLSHSVQLTVTVH